MNLKKSDEPKIIMCIAGNPNAGKSTFFNHCTNNKSNIGNWSGVTVELETGLITSEPSYHLIDLPGSYALRRNCSEDERVTFEFLSNTDNYDIIINIIDITALQQGLYFTAQLIELNKPMIIVLSKTDLLKPKQVQEIQSKLESIVNRPVLIFSNKRHQEPADLIEQAKSIKKLKNIDISKFYSKKLKNQINLWNKMQSDINAPSVIRLMESNYTTSNIIEEVQFNNIKNQIQNDYGEDLEIAIMNLRYSIASKIHDIIRPQDQDLSQSTSDCLDNILLHRYLGIPIFLFIMYLMFYFSIKIGGLFQECFEILTKILFINIPKQVLQYLSIDYNILLIFISGLGEGIATVAAFIPIIFALYLFLSFLEESGYLSRSAFIMNRFLSKLGLSGNSLIPIITGFGCNVPAIMSARCIDNIQNRIKIIMMVPFMSCSARLSVFSIFGAIFFTSDALYIILILYLIGIIFGILTLIILNKSSKNTGEINLMITLHDYQFPSFSIIMNKAYHKLKDFIFGAGRLIILVCFIIHIIGMLSFHDNKIQYNSNNDSILVQVGKAVTPIFQPIGISENNWPASVGLITGILAKEVLIGTINILYSSNNIKEQPENPSISESALIALNSIKNNFLELVGNKEIEESGIYYGLKQSIIDSFGSKLSAFCYMVFVLLYFPCISVFAVIKREIGCRWAILSSLWSTISAYSIATFFYQSGLYFLYHQINLIPIIIAVSFFSILTIILIKS